MVYNKVQNGYNEVLKTNKFIEESVPETLIAAAAATAKEAGLDGKWVFTLHNPSVMPFLQYADNRALREKIYKAYVCRGNNNNANDNKDVIKKLVVARLEKAKLLGYEDFAAYVLEENMAKNEKNVYDLLNKIWIPALVKAKEELADINAEIKKEGGNFEAEAWDWRYYFEKAKKAKFDFDENDIRESAVFEHGGRGGHTWSLTMSGKVLSMWRTNCMASLLLRCRTCRFPIRMPRFSNVRTRMVHL